MTYPDPVDRAGTPPAAPVPSGRPPRVRWVVNPGRLRAGEVAAVIVAAPAASVGPVAVSSLVPGIAESATTRTVV